MSSIPSSSKGVSPPDGRAAPLTLASSSLVAESALGQDSSLRLLMRSTVVDGAL